MLPEGSDLNDQIEDKQKAMIVYCHDEIQFSGK
jgi:hypothetical protein